MLTAIFILAMSLSARGRGAVYILKMRESGAVRTHATACIFVPLQPRVQEQHANPACGGVNHPAIDDDGEGRHRVPRVPDADDEEIGQGYQAEELEARCVVFALCVPAGDLQGDPCVDDEVDHVGGNSARRRRGPGKEEGPAVLEVQRLDRTKFGQDSTGTDYMTSRSSRFHRIGIHYSKTQVQETVADGFSRLKRARRT